MHSSYYVMTQSSLQQPKCNFSLQPGVPSQPVLLCPHRYSHMCWSRKSCHRKRITLRPWVGVLCCPLSCAIGTRCTAAKHDSCTRCPPSSLRMAERRRGWSLCPFPALDAWQQLSWWLNGLLKGFVVGMFIKQQFPIHTCSVISAPNYSQGTFWGLVCFGFFFRTGCSSLISAVQNYYSWLEKCKLWLSLLQLYCWSCGCCRGPSARKLRGSRRLEGTFLNTSLSWGR